MDTREILIKYKDLKYKEFHSKLTKTKYEILGIRIPILRKLSKDLIKNNMYIKILEEEVSCYEHLMLKGFIIGNLKIDINKKLNMLDEFSKYIDDWAVCDCTSSTIKILDRLFYEKSLEWMKSNKEFICRFGIVNLMNNFMNDEYIKDSIEQISKIKSKDYYVEMAIAWYIQKLYFKYKNKAEILLNSDCISNSVKNKAKQKIRDSIRERKNCIVI